MPPEQNFALLLAILVGLSLGALGSGGSIVTLPVLVYVAHIEPQAAVGMSMAIVGVTSLVAAYLHWRRGNFHLKAALLLGPSGMAGAYFGSFFTHLLSPSTLMLLFAGLMLVVGGVMFSDKLQRLAPGRCRPMQCLTVGLAVGVLTGFLGVGGGFVIVPALALLAGLETKKAIGTSLLIVSFNSFTGLAGQLRYVAVDWPMTALFTGLALAGMGFGLTLVDRITEGTVRRVFASLLLVIAVAVAAANL